MKKPAASRKIKSKVIRGRRPSKNAAAVSPRSEEFWEDWGVHKGDAQEDRGSDIAAQKSQVIMDMTIDGDLADNHRYARHNPSSGSGLGSRQASPHQPQKARTKGSAKRSRSVSRADNHQPTNR